MLSVSTWRPGSDANDASGGSGAPLVPLPAQLASLSKPLIGLRCCSWAQRSLFVLQLFTVLMIQRN